jgi:hypothetical protein
LNTALTGLNTIEEGVMNADKSFTLNVAFKKAFMGQEGRLFDQVRSGAGNRPKIACTGHTRVCAHQ